MTYVQDEIEISFFDNDLESLLKTDDELNQNSLRWRMLSNRCNQNQHNTTIPSHLYAAHPDYVY